jgi:TolB protein
MTPNRFFGSALILLFAAMSNAADEVQITFGPGRDCDPSVSPDGKHLAFSSNRAGNFDIYSLKFGENGFTQVTQSPEHDRYPAWSKDGKNIYFDSKRTGNGDIYETPFPAGGGYKQLTDREDIEEYACQSPKGSGFALARAPKKLVEVRRPMKVVLAATPADASSAREIADGDEPRFSPDGSKIVFTSHRTKNNDVWVMSADGGSQTQLTTDKKDDQNPCFSPDGKKVVFASKRTGNFDIWVMDADGSNQQQLTWSEADESQPCWSAGGYLYFVRKSSESNACVYRIKAP